MGSRDREVLLPRSAHNRFGSVDPVTGAAPNAARAIHFVEGHNPRVDRRLAAPAELYDLLLLFH